jgi:hypothetical protein
MVAANLAECCANQPIVRIRIVRELEKPDCFVSLQCLVEPSFKQNPRSISQGRVDELVPPVLIVRKNIAALIDSDRATALSSSEEDILSPVRAFAE